MAGIQGFFNSVTGQGVHKKNAYGDTPLYEAARHGNISAVKKLLKAGADPNKKNARGLTPLHQAAYWGETEIVELLLKAGADPNADNGLGWTPLHSAAISGGRALRSREIDLLVKQGALDSRPDKHGWTARDYMTLWQKDATVAAKLQEFVISDLARVPEENRRALRAKTLPFRKH